MRRETRIYLKTIKFVSISLYYKSLMQMDVSLKHVIWKFNERFLGQCNLCVVYSIIMHTNCQIWIQFGCISIPVRPTIGHESLLFAECCARSIRRSEIIGRIDTIFSIFCRATPNAIACPSIARLRRAPERILEERSFEYPLRPMRQHLYKTSDRDNQLTAISSFLIPLPLSPAPEYERARRVKIKINPETTTNRSSTRPATNQTRVHLCRLIVSQLYRCTKLLCILSLVLLSF